MQTLAIREKSLWAKHGKARDGAGDGVGFTANTVAEVRVAQAEGRVVQA